LHSDALNALLGLGISRQAAEQAIQKTLAQEPGLPLEDLIKKALRIL
jgi:Holliday junction DNA helicase RuvA